MDVTPHTTKSQAGDIAIAAYRFADLGELGPLRARLLERCQHLGLKGTILLSIEGINVFVAGAPGAVGDFVTELRTLPGLAGLEVKQSPAPEQPFNRMLVKIKKEIIAFGDHGVDPVHKPAPRISAQTLKQWLDEGRRVTLLDTRNDYEVALGTFRGARAIGVDEFRQFPDAVRALPEALKRETIVTFCTGGIRCEKAAPFMQNEGFESVFQLDGGILKYFEECGGAHYDGECFVFDKRTGLDPNLQPTATVTCFACLMPVTAEAQRHPHYVVGTSCPRCFKRA